MTLYEFISLSEADQANATWNGTFLHNRVEGEFGFNLYDLGEFFVEVNYNIKANKIERYRPFRKASLLEPYIEHINLRDLM